MTEQTGGRQIIPGADGHGTLEIVDNPDRGRFELREGEQLIGMASYALVPGADAATEQDADPQPAPERIVLFHTEVLPEYEGEGLAAHLASHALDAAIAAGRAIVVLCPYITVYLRRHPEPYAAHVVAPTRADVDAAKAAQ